MATIIRYAGDQPRSEIGITGIARRWWPGELRPVDDNVARQLAGAGLGWEVERNADTYLDEVVRPVEGASLLSAVSRKNAAACGDSLLAGTSGIASSPYTQLIRNGVRLVNSGNFSVGGKRLDEFAPQRENVFSSGAAIVVSGGGANDVAQGKSLSNINADWLSHVNELRNEGLFLVDVGMAPTNTAGNVNLTVAHEIWRKLYCYKHGIRHADVWRSLAQASGAFRSGMFFDAVHWNVPGASLARAEIERVLFDNFADQRPLLAMTDSPAGYNAFLTNAVSFAGGGALPNNWFSVGSGGSYSVTAPDSGDLGSWLRCTVNSGTNVGYSGQAVTLSSLGWSVGHRIALGFRARSTMLDGNMTLNCYWGGISEVGQDQPMYIDQFDTLTFYREATIASGTTINVQWMATGSGWFEINRPIVVNLTLLGLA